MKSPWPWFLIIIFSILGLFVISRLVAPKIEEQKITIENPQKNEETITPPPPTTNNQTEIKTLPAGWKINQSKSFSIETPEEWVVSTQGQNENQEIIALRSGGDDAEAFRNLEIVNLNVLFFLKNDTTFEQIKAEKIKNQDDAEAAVKIMIEGTSSPFNEITIDDIKISLEEIQLNNNLMAFKNTYQCLKSCDLDGGPYTLTQYLIEADDKIFLINCLTGIDEKAEALRLVAEQVVKTFQTK